MNSYSIKNIFEDAEIKRVEKRDNDLYIVVSQEVYSFMIANGFREEDNNMNLTQVCFTNVNNLNSIDAFFHGYVKNVTIKEKTIDIETIESNIVFEYDECLVKKIYTLGDK